MNVDKYDFFIDCTNIVKLSFIKPNGRKIW